MLPFRVESWVWYGIATAILLARIAARVLHFGTVKRLQSDDYLMVLTLAFYTTETVAINKAATASTNLLPPNYLQTHTMSPEEISERVYGSKMTLLVEQCQCATIWLVKACLLIMYHRITVGAFPKQNIAVKVLAAYVAITFVVMEVCYFAVWCRPFSNYFAVPTPNAQCDTALNHLIMNAVFNLSSDVAMIAIALPMFIRSHLPLQRKLTLSVIFSLGAFVILAAVLNKYYSFQDPFGTLWTYWYVRECSTAVLVANLPFLWGLVRRCLGLQDDNEPRSAIIWQKRPGLLPNLRRKLSVIPGLQISSPTAVGSSYRIGTHKGKPSADQSSGHSGSPMINGDPMQNSFALQPWNAGDRSPSHLEAGEEAVSRATSRASSRLSSNRPVSLNLPTSRLEAELMADEGLPSPRLPFHLRQAQDPAQAVAFLSPPEKAGRP